MDSTIEVSQAVALRIQELLKAKNITRYKLAQKSCLSHDTIKSIMKNKAKGVTLKTIILLAEGFGITAAEFLDSSLFDRDNFDI